MNEVDELHDISTQARRLAAVDVTGLSRPELCQVALDARRLRELADRLEVHALGALDETGHTDATHGMLTANWFARHTAMPPSIGRAQITLARRL